MENRVAFIENGLIANIINSNMAFAATLGGEILDVTGVPCGVGYPVVNGEVKHPDTLLSPAELQEKKENEAREWRNEELSRIDFIVPLIDHPQHEAYMQYRQLLRDWPSTNDFPTTKPLITFIP